MVHSSSVPAYRITTITW